MSKAKAELYRRYPLLWLLGDAEGGIEPQAYTKDEHDPSVAFKPFPQKEYIREVVRIWLSYKMQLWEKSRQVMLSWTLCGLYAHDAQFGVNRLNFIQSKKEEDSDRLVQRCFTLWQNQAEWLRVMFPAEYSYCHLRFYRLGDEKLPYSEIWGIPQGGDIIRQHTGSSLLIDEAAFQPELEAAIGAAKPMISGGGRIDLVSSAEPGYFEQLALDAIQ